MININTKVLNAFITLVEYQHFTKAASKLHMSQSALSALISKLEKDLNVPLLIRNTRQMELSHNGENFYKIAKEYLHQHNQLLDSFLNDAQRNASTIKIAALPSIAASWLPDIIDKLIANHTHINIEIYDCLSEECIQLVKQGIAHFALAAPRYLSREFQAKLLYQDYYYVICHKNHPLASEKKLRLQDIQRFTMISLAQETSVRQFLNSHQKELPPSTDFLVRNISTAVSFVRKGLGICLLPGLTFSLFSMEDLVSIPLTSSTLAREIQLIQNPYSKHQNTELSQNFILHLMDYINRFKP